MGELASRLNKNQLDISESPVSSEQLGAMLIRLKDETISSKGAKTVFEGLWNGEGTPDEIIEKRGLKAITDTSAIEAMIDEVIANNAAQVEQYRSAEEAKQGKMIGFFVGQVMKASRGAAEPGVVNKLLREKLKG